MAIEIERRPLTAAPSAQARPHASRSAESGIKALWERVNRESTKVGSRERMFFTERLSLLLETGVPLHTGLESLAKQATHGEFAALTRTLRDEVRGGSTFARALAAHPDVFPPTYVNLVAAAELGGFLSVALERLRDMEERRDELRSTLTSALSYPVILAVFSSLVVVFVLVVVFPKFADIFSMIHDELPVTTRWLMATSDILRRWWLPILIGSVVAFKLMSTWVRGPQGSAFIDRALLSIPGVRDIVIQLNVVQLLRVLGLSLENRVGMVEALRSSRDAVSSSHFRSLIGRIEIAVNEGRGLQHGFNNEPLVPELVKQMIETGEESGALPSVMNRLADFYERELRRLLAVVAKIAEPVMLLIMGSVVGLIVSSLILPIFKISRAVH